MAQIGLPYRAKHNMRDVVPLPAPYTILISPTDFCNIKCSFCAYHGSTDPLGEKKEMPLDFYKMIIDQIAEFPVKIARLNFSGFGEPTLHKDLPEMIAYANQKNIADEIMLATNGLLLNPEYNRKLIDAGLDYIRISVPATDNKTASSIAGRPINVEGEYIENIRNLFENKTDMTVLCKTTNFAVGEGESEKTKRFYSEYDDACDYIIVENIAPWGGTDEEALAKQGLDKTPDTDVYGRPVKRRNLCEFLYYALTVDSKGDVRPCCSVEAPVIGTIDENTTIREIWDSEILRRLRLANINGMLEVCKNCGVNSFVNINDIDKDAEILRERILNTGIKKEV